MKQEKRKKKQGRGGTQIGEKTTKSVNQGIRIRTGQAQAMVGGGEKEDVENGPCQIGGGSLVPAQKGTALGVPLWGDAGKRKRSSSN